MMTANEQCIRWRSLLLFFNRDVAHMTRERKRTYKRHDDVNYCIYFNGYPSSIDF